MTSYYVTNGEIADGPFTTDQLLKKIAHGKVKENSKLSDDGVSWKTATDLVPQLFAQHVPSSNQANNSMIARESKSWQGTTGITFFDRMDSQQKIVSLIAIGFTIAIPNILLFAIYRKPIIAALQYVENAMVSFLTTIVTVVVIALLVFLVVYIVTVFIAWMTGSKPRIGQLQVWSDPKHWRPMRDMAFENFIQQVCGAYHGLKAGTTPVTGDQGIDLVIIIDNERIAVQVKGYEGSVGNASVQQAVAGMRLYNCNACAVITNSLFTRQAIELARANRCSLIDQDSIQRFINDPHLLASTQFMAIA